MKYSRSGRLRTHFPLDFLPSSNIIDFDWFDRLDKDHIIYRMGTKRHIRNRLKSIVWNFRGVVEDFFWLADRHDSKNFQLFSIILLTLRANAFEKQLRFSLLLLYEICEARKVNNSTQRGIHAKKKHQNILVHLKIRFIVFSISAKLFEPTCVNT